MPKTQVSIWYLYISVLFVAILMISNTVASKIIQLGPFSVTGAIFLFPVSYIFGDVLTEVYGYRGSRRVIWMGFVALILMAVAYWVARTLPSASFWQGQDAFVAVLGTAPRIVLASITGYFVGEFANSYVLSRMKVWMQGTHLWMRTIGSTIIGEGLDTVFFILIAFWGVLPTAALGPIIISSYVLKVSYEILATPLTYKVVQKLKQIEGIDTYDREINYNPFVLGE